MENDERKKRIIYSILVRYQKGPWNRNYVEALPRRTIFFSKAPNFFCQQYVTLIVFLQDVGCLWSGPLNGLKAHLNVCPKDAVDCLNQCGAKIGRSLMEDHMLYTCPKRLVTCSYCRKDFTGKCLIFRL